MPDAERLAEDVRRRALTRHLLLLLDFDGTLCEFEADPAAVQLPAPRRAILRKLQARATIGIISGRRLEDVRARCALDGDIVTAGLHGLEIDALGERYVHPGLDTGSAAIASVANALGQALDLPGVFVEDKGASVALHFREADEADRHAAVDAFTALATPFVDSGILRVMPGSHVLELLPNIDWTKGDAVEWITERVRRRRGDTFVVYIGDDVTDRDAFAAVERDGLSIAASDRVSGHARLDGPSAVERFLAAL